MRVKKITSLLAVLAVAVSVAGASSCDTQTKTGSNDSGQKNSQPAKATSQQIFDQVQTGMTREQVVQIAGKEPDNCIDSEIAGLGKSSTCSYGTVSIMFSNGTVSSKTKL